MWLPTNTKERCAASMPPPLYKGSVFLMTAENNDTSAQFDVFATYNGYEIHVKLSGPKVYGDALKLLARMEADGFRPRGSGAVVHAQPSNGSNPTQDTPFCQIHQTELRRFEKGNRVWYSHLGPDSKWCKG